MSRRRTVIDLARDWRDLTADDRAAEVTIVGPNGVHTFPSEDPDPPEAWNTLLLAGCYEALEELHLDEGYIREEYGQVTPETLGAFVTDQIRDWIGADRFARLIGEDVEERAAAWEGSA